jgi:precorrin-4/cobalt-precorrin-4 C11-methyltransferase
MAVFLSAGDLSGTVAELREHYPAETAAAIVQRASWPEQLVLRGTLATIAEQAAAAGVDRTAMILVGDALRGEGDASLLYDPGFTHGYRQAEGDGDPDGRASSQAAGTADHTAGASGEAAAAASGGAPA